MEKTIHQGKNVKRFREMLGIKQDALALDLGLSQQAISALEQKEIIDDKILNDVAKILKVPADAFKNFDEEGVINIIASTLHDTNGLINYSPTFNVNPIEKWIEALEENKKLYERLLQAEREKVALLEKILDKK